MSEHSFGVKNDGTSDGVVGGPDPECAAVLQGRRREDGAIAVAVVVEVTEEKAVEAIRLALARVPDDGDNFCLEGSESISLLQMNGCFYQ